MFISNPFLSAQNLVKNPSFEEYYQCPVYGDFNGYIKHWYGFSSGNPKLFNTCSSSKYSVPNNYLGYQPAKTGNGYASILVLYYSFSLPFNPRSYVEGSLYTPLEKDSLYSVEYHLSLCGEYIAAIKNVDAHFSDTLLDWNWHNGHGLVLTNIEPQIKSHTVLNDSVGWMKVKSLYKAKGGEKHITIGNFLPHNKTEIFYFGSEQPSQIHYYIDDVSVVPLNITAPSLGKDTTICKNKIPYTLTAPSGYDAYEWSNGDTTSSIEVKTGGEYWVKCFLASCGFVADTVSISLYNSPELQLGRDTTICKGSKIKLSAQAGFDSYLWNTSESTADIEISKTGSYIVTAKDQCGTQSDTIFVEIDSVPDLQINIGTDTTLCRAGESLPITLSSNLSLPNYYWSNGSSSKEITINKKGNYWLESSFPCGVLKSNTVFVDGCPPDTIELYIPNSFTPNGDGLNDVFYAVPQNLEIFDLSIFNRWGEMIYKSQNHYTWDGNCNGLPCQAGIYVYMFRYRDKYGNFGQKSGTVHLLR